MNWENLLSFFLLWLAISSHSYLLYSSGRTETVKTARIRFVAPSFIHLLVKYLSIDNGEICLSRE